VAAAKANGIWVALHFAPGRAEAEVNNGAPTSTPCAGYAKGSSALGQCVGSSYAGWVNSFISALAGYQNVLMWGINYGIQLPQNSPQDPYTAFWQTAYPAIVDQLQTYPYTFPSGRALTMLESGFGGIWPINPATGRQDVQPILSLQPWSYLGSNYIGYQWNWQTVASDVSLWQQTGIQPDLWAFQMYNASAADLEAALECVAGVANSVCSAPQQAIPFSKMVVTEAATGSSFESPPVGNNLAIEFDSQVPTTTAPGQSQWLTNTFCAFSRHGVPAFGWYGLYDSASWWEANYDDSGPLLAAVGYWGLSSEIASYGNKPAWNAMLGFPSNCPSGFLPPAPVLGLYADAPYYTQGDVGIIAYTAADVSSLSLSEPPSSGGIFSCETSDLIQSGDTPLVGSCAALYVAMQITTQQITLSGSNSDVNNSQSPYQTDGSASAAVTVGPNPIIGGIQDYNTGQTCNFTQNPGCVLTANQDDILVVYGEGFSISGGNTIHFTGPGDVWLYETDGYYYWDDSRTQINAQVGCYVSPGAWSFSVLNPKSGNPSATYSINIVSSPSCP
jgi:hypothetical protein